MFQYKKPKGEGTSQTRNPYICDLFSVQKNENIGQNNLLRKVLLLLGNVENTFI